MKPILNSLSIAAGALLLLPTADALHAQTVAGSSQTQSAGKVTRLNAALQRLARDPQSVDALIAAGTAALDIGDIDAAIGFFGRADELSPGNPRAKLGMAAGFLRSDRPIEALRLFSEAEAAGISSDLLAGDRGLAYDLVGDNVNAQEQYRIAMGRNPTLDMARRQAASLAISGDREGFEEALLPYLRRRDLAAFRTRALGLAILGDASEAQRIVDAVMPKNMAQQLTPYLEYMPRLTRAQQAAAANLGRFPQASDIGRDDPRLAEFSDSGTSAAREADRRLEPQGQPLGTITPPEMVSSPVTQTLPASPPERETRVAAATPTPQQPPQGSAPAPVSRQSMSDAFSGFSLPTASDTSRAGDAVDITAIEPPREVEAPPPPRHPSRIWVQVATGRDLRALKFDWRRLSRRAPKLLGDFSPHTTPWGQANRLLAGPYPDAAAARAAINALKSKGIDTFGFTSPEGQEIRELR